MIRNSTVPLAIAPTDKNAHRADKAILDWATEAIREGEAVVQNNRGYDRINEMQDAIMGEQAADALRPGSFSRLNLNHFAETAGDLAASLTDTKIFWEYKDSTGRYDRQQELAQKMASLWWSNRLVDLKFANVVKYCLTEGSGYAHLTWDSDIQDMNLMAEDARDVLPIRPPTDYVTIQECQGVILRRGKTVNYLKHKYPTAAPYIQADRDGSFTRQNAQTRAAKLMDQMGLKSGFIQNLYASLGGSAQAKQPPIPMADEFTIYVKDDSVNETGENVVMGEPLSNWAYIVKPGQPLYPRLRCLVLTRSAKLYDGPSPYWHGLFPCPKLTLDPWPGSWLGKIPLLDLLSPQAELNRTARGISDLFEKNWRPDLIADKNSIAKALMDRIDTRRAGLKLRTNPVAGQGAQIVYPTNDQIITLAMAWMQFLIEEIKRLAGTEELTSLAQLGQIPATETIERMIEAMTPTVRMRSRVMEAFIREVAMIVLSNMFQFYTADYRAAMFGPQGLTLEDADLNPGSLIPSDYGTSELSEAERAVRFLSHFRYEITPGSMLSAAGVTEKLLYIQLSRMGYMDAITLLEKLGVPNIGAPDEAGKTIFERMQYLSGMGFGMQVGAQGASAAGRKASNETMPRMVLKTSS